MTAQNETPTPETDRSEFYVNTVDPGKETAYVDGMCVSAAHARQLERRLAASQAECERLRQERETLRVNIGTLVAGPMMHHHKMDACDIRVAEAFNRCRELTLANFATHFSLADAIRAAMQAGQGVQG